jgi:glycine/D-amino acid oxidase-like deaminating enzyme/nitrite reductase/ring-hydroxylating ferredoxin subunit
MKSQSIWIAAGQDLRFPALTGNVSADVAVVGGGITGLLCAEALAADGADVVVLESYSIGEGSTGNSTGNLYSLVGERGHALAREEARWLIEARAQAVDRIERLVQAYGIDCGFLRCPWVMYAESDVDARSLRQACELIEAAELQPRDARSLTPFEVRAAVGVERQAQFNPLRFARGLASQLAGARCRIHESTRVTGFDVDAGRLATEHGDVTAGWVILASHSPKGRLLLHGELICQREYAVAAPIASERLAPGIFWSAEEPFRSIRRYDLDGRSHVVVVGESHRVGDEEDTEACYAALEQFARERFGIRHVEYRWSAQNYRSADALPYIGPSGLGEHVLVATGFAADGLTYAGVAAPLIADSIARRDNPLLERFDPRRIRASAAPNVVRQSLHEFRHYAEDIPGLDAKPAAIAPGEARLCDQDGEKLAVHCDSDGALHVVSAVCTHFQCLVHWNSAERSWDCPCHGSRFDPDGNVIEGPAYDPLPVRTLHDSG